MVLMVALAGCSTGNTGAISIAGASDQWICFAFRPIFWSRQDTDRTRDQIVQHNAAWEALCGDK